MDKRTRVLAAMNGEAVDKVPVGFWFHFLGERSTGEACVRGHLDYYRRADVDFMKIMSDGFTVDPDFKIATAADWSRIRPKGPKSAYVEGQVERCKRIAEELKGECCLFYNIFAPFTLIREMKQTSDEMVMAHLKENEAGILSALQAVAEDQASLIERVMTEAGFDGGYFSFQGGEEDRFSPEEYARLITPSDRVALDHAHTLGDNHFVHMCGYIGRKNHLDSWKDYPSKVVNWATYIEGLTLREGHARFGKPVLGGFDNRKQGLLYTGTKEQIQAETRRLIDDFGSTTGIIIGADCTIPYDIDLERIQWVVEATKNYK